MLFVNFIISFSFCKEFFGQGAAAFEDPPHCLDLVFGKCCNFSMISHDAEKDFFPRGDAEFFPDLLWDYYLTLSGCFYYWHWSLTSSQMVLQD